MDIKIEEAIIMKREYPEEEMSDIRLEQVIYSKHEASSIKPVLFEDVGSVDDTKYEYIKTESIDIKSDPEEDDGGESDTDLPEQSQGVMKFTKRSIPLKSKGAYEYYYTQFMNWRDKHNIKSFSEAVFLAYFEEKSSNLNSSSLRPMFSMLRRINIKKNSIDIGKYVKLKAFLKQQSEKYQVKKPNIFTACEVKKFINEAPDDVYLATKVALIVSIVGACSKSELHRMKVNHVQDFGDKILIRVPERKSEFENNFTVVGQFCTIIKKYLALRPHDLWENNFFVKVHGNRCNGVIGIHKLGFMPKEIAEYLKLENPKQYTGHCFRRTSAAMLVDADGDVHDNP